MANVSPPISGHRTAKDLFSEFHGDELLSDEEMELVKSKVVGEIYYAWKIPLSTIDDLQKNRQKVIPCMFIPPCCCLSMSIVCGIDRRSYMERVIFVVSENGVTTINRGPGGCIICCNASGYGQDNIKLNSWDNILDSTAQINQQACCGFLTSPPHVILTLKTMHSSGGDNPTMMNDKVVLWHNNAERLAQTIMSVDRINGNVRGQKVYFDQPPGVVTAQPGAAPPSYDANKVRIFVSVSSAPASFQVITVNDGTRATFEQLVREKFNLEKADVKLHLADVDAPCEFEDIQNNDKVVVQL
eukprot:m.245818 g.245818  ORF g.245818 m.245818 type:complete len:300 (-) comp16109_c3_seq26:1183-2082(-)